MPNAGQPMPPYVSNPVDYELLLIMKRRADAWRKLGGSRWSCGIHPWWHHARWWEHRHAIRQRRELEAEAGDDGRNTDSIMVRITVVAVLSAIGLTEARIAIVVAIVTIMVLDVVEVVWIEATITRRPRALVASFVGGHSTRYSWRTQLISIETKSAAEATDRCYWIMKCSTTEHMESV